MLERYYVHELFLQGLGTTSEISTAMWVTASGPDEPDALWDVTYQGVTWIDHAGWWSPMLLVVLYPVLRKYSRSLAVSLKPQGWSFCTTGLAQHRRVPVPRLLAGGRQGADGR